MNEALQHTEIETLIDMSTGRNGEVPVGQSYWLQATETNFGLFEQEKKILLERHLGYHRSAREPKEQGSENRQKKAGSAAASISVSKPSW